MQPQYRDNPVWVEARELFTADMRDDESAAGALIRRHFAIDAMYCAENGDDASARALVLAASNVTSP